MTSHKRARLEEIVDDDATAPTHLAKLRAKYKSKLDGAKFRMLNEELYTTTGAEAFKTMGKTAFTTYHEGFGKQVSKWPSNPVDVILREDLLPLARKAGGVKRVRIGDFGCGEAKIARELKSRTTPEFAFDVQSFDLVAHNEDVTACDIANVPLGDSVLDVAVFSLSLMGTNYLDFVREAHRTLRPGGRLVVAEVKSRFAGDKAEEGDSRARMMRGINSFVDELVRVGFKRVDLDVESHKMFVVMRFVKTRDVEPASEKNASTTSMASSSLKSCKYKRR